MAEPISSTTAASSVSGASFGLLALLVGAVGPVAADVMMVIMSAIAGCMVALSGLSTNTIKESVFFLFQSIFLSLLFAWLTASLLVPYLPDALNTPSLPSIVAFCIGFLSKRLPAILNDFTNKTLEKAGVKGDQ